MTLVQLTAASGSLSQRVCPTYAIPSPTGSLVLLHCRIGHALTGISLISPSGQGPPLLDRVTENWCILALTEAHGAPLALLPNGSSRFQVPVDYPDWELRNADFYPLSLHKKPLPALEPCFFVCFMVKSVPYHLLPGGEGVSCGSLPIISQTYTVCFINTKLLILIPVRKRDITILQSRKLRWLPKLTKLVCFRAKTWIPIFLILKPEHFPGCRVGVEWKEGATAFQNELCYSPCR